MTKNSKKIKEAVGVFDDLEKMQEAISELEKSGFERASISVLGSESAMKDEFGKSHENPEKLKDNPQAPRSSNIAPEEVGIAQGVLLGSGAALGVVASVIALGGIAISGAAITTVVAGGVGGTAIGGILAKILGNKYAEFFQKQIDKGGLLLWVKTENTEKEDKASIILKKHGAENVNIHEISAN